MPTGRSPDRIADCNQRRTALSERYERERNAVRDGRRHGAGDARPSTGICCLCGNDTWIDDWAIVDEANYMRASVRVNRVEVRWAPRLTIAELLARANDLVGQPASSVREVARERWQVRNVSSGRGETRKALRATWGQPNGRGRRQWRWITADRSVTAEVGTHNPRITIRGV